ncbi:MAG: AAA domain-containing protein [Planctomycetaceae bacterium]|nr:AAA domain-containing protein [Planctomycetaceae bacterium]MCP4773881.1 AAA domain-containing protein [Planctomycetaceae bacterium]
MNNTVELQTVSREANEFRKLVIERLGKTLIDLDSVLEQVLIATIAQGHVLLEGVPGTAKTTLCRTLASAMGLDFNRIQFTPDLMPSDVTGTRILDQSKSKFVLQRGPIFCQLLLADELNRAPARTQSALLEAMQEGQVTIEGETLMLPKPFVVLATQNPVEQEGVYRLPEAQLDRFLFRVNVGYPDRSSEIELMELQERTVAAPGQLCDANMILRFQSAVSQVYGKPEMKEYVVDLIRKTREHHDILLGASPRAGIYLLRAARSHALLHGQEYFSHENVQAVIHAILEHRVIVRPEAELSGRTAAEIVREIVQSVAIRN